MEEWILNQEKIHCLLGTPEHLKVEFFAFHFESDALMWWRSIIKIRRGFYTWATFL
ncbi:hypothetical protein Scep_021447 [Stephania cephalantha]|uniref:Uncharacterized protein n=1 Tax=Stephania cephalantha TaxID=152367 RepID=A0AAP0FB64_9MAGN